MDGVTHVLAGLCVAAASQQGLTLKQTLLCVGASLGPDAFFVPLAVVLGRDAKRPFWIPWNQDWQGARERYPRLVAVSWDVPYSLLGAAAVTCVLAWSLGGAVAVAYASHIALDYPTHVGEWSVMPLYPFSRRALPGVSSAWEWPLHRLWKAWALMVALLALILWARRFA